MRDALWMIFFSQGAAREKPAEGLCFLFVIQNPSAGAFSHQSGCVTTLQRVVGVWLGGKQSRLPPLAPDEELELCNFCLRFIGSLTEGYQNQDTLL